MFGRFLNNKKEPVHNTVPQDFSDISTGWDEEKIVVELQPQISAADGKVIGAEALSRYKETDDNVLSPLMFVPLLESASVVSQLDLVVVKKVGEMMARWNVTGRGSVPISINLSRIDFSERGFMDKVHASFLEQGIAPSKITFEIHESSLIDSFETMRERIISVHDKGYHIAIDDFGSNGHLIMLPFDLPVDTVKFDLGYLKSAAKSNSGRRMAEGLVDGFKKAGLRLICEGVETDEDRSMATGLGIEDIQGFLYDRPLDISTFESKYL